MPLNKGKHTVEEINGTRCTIVELGVSKERADFLFDLLTFNKYDVKISLAKKKTETDPDTYVIGVTDIVFNPVIVLYEKKLKTPEGRIVSPSYWNQWDQYNKNIPYWIVNRKLEFVDLIGRY